MRFSKGLTASLLLIPTWASAAEYHVASGPCSHGTAIGSDANAGTTRQTAFATVQRCLDALKGGDTCIVHEGTYAGNFNCCGNGDATIEPTVGTAGQPTRILGAPGDAAILAGTASQTLGDLANYYGTNLATLTFKGASNASKFFELGNLGIRPGSSAAVAFTRAQNFYVHDISIDDLSLYANRGNGEATGLFWSYDARYFFFDRVKISNHGAIVPYNAFCGMGHDGTARMLDLADMDGAVEASHFNTNVDYEWVRIRNWQPYGGDDGCARDGYNSHYGINRYWSVQKANGTGIKPAIFGWFNSRRTNSYPACGQISTLYASNMFLEDSAIGTTGVAAWMEDTTYNAACQMDAVTDMRVFNSVAMRHAAGVLNRDSSGAPPRCARHEIDFNAFISVPTPAVSKSASQCGFTIGAHSILPPSANATDHVPDVTSPLRDTGDDRTFGPTPWFPPPIGGGSRIDIGAYEVGAGAWPYEFQSIAQSPKTTPRICWDASPAGCDVVIPLLDPSARDSTARKSIPSWYWIEIDPSTDFRSGNDKVAKGFGALFSSGPVASTDRFFDVPASVLSLGKSYYVRVRVGERSDPTTSGEGPGPWPLGFHRFDVGATMLPPTADAGGEDATAPESSGGDSVRNAGCGCAIRRDRAPFDPILMLLGLVWLASRFSRARNS